MTSAKPSDNRRGTGTTFRDWCHGIKALVEDEEG